MTDRRKHIQNIKKKKKKQKSKELTPIYFCDASGCMNITTEENKMACSNCLCFYYCNKECQQKHWLEAHKNMCCKEPTTEHEKKLDQYKEARDAAEAIFNKVKNGNYTTVIHEKSNVPAAIFATIAQKSNVLNWRQYIQNPLFTTSSHTAFGTLTPKIKTVQSKYSTSKLYAIVVIFDKLQDGKNNEAIVRLFIAESFGETMDAPDGKVIQQVVKYRRK